MATSCTWPTDQYSSGCAMLLHYDTDGDGIISMDELFKALDDAGIGKITEEEAVFINGAYAAGSINAFCPGCYSTPPSPTFNVGDTVCYTPDQATCTIIAVYVSDYKLQRHDTGQIFLSSRIVPGACGVSPPPTPPPNMETRTMSLTEGKSYPIQVSLAGYNTLNATINVSSTGVTCVSVTGGACGGTGLPRVSTSGWAVTTYLKEGAAATNRCGWIASKDTSKVVFISEMVLAYNNLKNIGFTPTAAEIGNAVLMYSKLGTPDSLWGC